MNHHEKAFDYLLTKKPIHEDGPVIHKAIIRSDKRMTYLAKHPEYNIGCGTLSDDDIKTLPKIDRTKTDIKFEYTITYQKFAALIKAMQQKMPVMADSMHCKRILALSIHPADTIHPEPWWGCVVLDNNGSCTYQIPLEYVECETQADVAAVQHIIRKLPSEAFMQPWEGGETGG